MVCGVPFVDQAVAAGYSERHFYRLITGPWEAWKIRNAQKWCKACGVSMWDIKLSPEMVKRVDWSSERDSVTRALSAFYFHKTGRKATRSQLQAFGESTCKVFKIERPPCGTQG